MEENSEYKLFIPVLDIFFEGNKFRDHKFKVPFKEFNNDVINKEKEKELEKHFIKWYKYVNNIDDSDEDE